MKFTAAKSVRARVARLLLSGAVIAAAPLGATYAASLAGLGDWPPRPSGTLGYGCGVALGVVILFEMLLAPRKWLRGRRLGATRVWLKLHVWLGLASLPLALLHSGLGFGGPLPAVTLALFLAVFASGVWGLMMQQWLPQKVLGELPGETIASQIPMLARSSAEEAERLLGTLDGPAGVGRFADAELLPYLRSGKRSNSKLAARSEAERRFREFRAASAPELAIRWDRLKELVDLRRQWDAALSYHFWLHNWLLIHLPLSVLMTGLMVVHAVRALKYW